MSDRLDPSITIHWQRPRKDGSVDFHFQARGEKLKGNIAPASDLPGLLAIFEQHIGMKLPDPSPASLPRP